MEQEADSSDTDGDGEQIYDQHQVGRMSSDLATILTCVLVSAAGQEHGLGAGAGGARHGARLSDRHPRRGAAGGDRGRVREPRHRQPVLRAGQPQKHWQ